MDIKNEIIKFLKQHKGKKYNVNQLFIGLKKSGIKTSYPTVLKNVDILIASNNTNIKSQVYEDILKLVWYENENEDK